MIVFQCEECGTSLQALDQNAGKKARCQCGAVMPIPDAPVPDMPAPAAATYDPAPYQPSDPLPTLAEHQEATRGGVSVGSMMWGFCLMVVGVLWFVASLANGRTSGSAVVIFFIGLFRVFGAFNKQ